MRKNIKGRIASAVSAAAMAATAFGSYSAAMPANAAGLTGQSAFDITSKMTIGWNLGNTLECSGTNLASDAKPGKFAKAWGQPEPTAELYKTVRNAGFNTVRIPVTWYEHLEWDEGSKMYLVNDTWMDYVKQNVDWAYDNDMFVIINVHHEAFINVNGEFTDATYNDASKKLGDIWTQVSEAFKDYDQHLIFEVLNEPREVGTKQEWNGGYDSGRNYVNRLNEVAVNAIRGNGSAANKERLIMLTPYGANEGAAGSLNVPANAGNAAISVHAYAPYYFTMANDDKANHNWPGQSGWGEDYEQSLDGLFGRLQQISQQKNMPIIMGEFSASDFNNTDSRVAWAKAYLNRAKNVGIPCVLWDNNVPYAPDLADPGEAHGYLYRKTNTWYPNSAPVIKAMMEVYGQSCNLPAYEPYVEPPFSWDNIPVGDNWVELYKSDGKDLDAWKNFTVSGWQDYVNENYDLVMIYKSEHSAELVLQGSGEGNWNRIIASDDSETPYMLTFTYDDVIASLKGKDVASMENLYISATQSGMTAYGLYAVPKGGSTQPTETEPVTEPTTEPAPTFGDVDGDGSVSVLDIVVLQKYLLKAQALNDPAQADLNGDGEVDVFDLGLLKKAILK